MIGYDSRTGVSWSENGTVWQSLPVNMTAQPLLSQTDSVAMVRTLTTWSCSNPHAAVHSCIPCNLLRKLTLHTSHTHAWLTTVAHYLPPCWQG